MNLSCQKHLQFTNVRSSLSQWPQEGDTHHEFSNGTGSSNVAPEDEPNPATDFSCVEEGGGWVRPWLEEEVEGAEWLWVSPPLLLLKRPFVLEPNPGGGPVLDITQKNNFQGTSQRALAAEGRGRGRWRWRWRSRVGQAGQ